MNKKLMIVVTAALTVIGAYAESYPVPRPIVPGQYAAAKQQVCLNQVAYQGRYQTTVVQPQQVRAAKTSNLPGTVRTVYVRAKHKVVRDANGNKQRIYIPAHYEQRVGTYQ